MNETEVISAVKGGVIRQLPNVTDANAEVIARGLILKAVLKVGRMNGVDWNKEAVSFNLTSGQSVYKCGIDILSAYSRIKNLQYLWRTDTQDSPIRIVNLQEFNAYRRGATGTGKPELATLHSADETLEVWRTPDTTYAVWGYVQKRIVDLKDIPDIYYDVVIDVAVSSLDPRNAVVFAQLGLDEMRKDSLTIWEGNSIPLGRHLGEDYAGTHGDSYNLRGD